MSACIQGRDGSRYQSMYELTVTSHMNDVLKADHTTGKISPTLFDQYCGLFYIPSDLTHERMKVTRPMA